MSSSPTESTSLNEVLNTLPLKRNDCSLSIYREEEDDEEDEEGEGSSGEKRSFLCEEEMEFEGILLVRWEVDKPEKEGESERREEEAIKIGW